MPQFICRKCRATKPDENYCRDCGESGHFTIETQSEIEASAATGKTKHEKKPAKPGVKEYRPTELELGAKIDQAIEARLKGAIEARLGTAIDEDKITAIARREIDAHVARIREVELAATLVPEAEPIEAAAFEISGPAEIEAIAVGEKGPRKFTSKAYTGGALSVAGYDEPIVIDLAGLAPAKSVVANLYHDKARIIGHIPEVENNGRELILSGFVSVPGPDADKFTQAHDNQFPWQASVEVKPLKLEQVPEGRTATANGKTFEGPVYIARKSRLHGVAFLPRGADENTSVSIAAGAEETALAG